MPTFNYLNRIATLIFCLIFFQNNLFSQPNFTANDTIQPYQTGFLAGVNPGSIPGFSDDNLADFAAGNPTHGIEGIGAKTLRPGLTEIFLEKYGYDIRIPTFEYYKNLGMKDHTAIVGFPSDDHRDPNFYCPDHQSELFSNMYDPIWDGGANGTPVNDQNHAALYFWKMATRYKNYIKFWEIWNEPGFDYTSLHGFSNPGQPANWWDNDPTPCDYKLRAPIQHYVRLLRIAYEVIKTADPTAYVLCGGVGYPSFLDAVLRNTDNPDGGKITPNFPRSGGAYFDAVGYHSYPHFDSSVRDFNDATQEFDYFRHSDRAAEGISIVKNRFTPVLKKHGYDGSKFPEKIWLVTEINVPRLEFPPNLMGGEELQKNFMIKAFVQCARENFAAMHIYALAEAKTEAKATFEFDVMGLYKKLDVHNGIFQEKTSEAIALKTAADVLTGKKFDAAKTAAMNLPSQIGGAAFIDEKSQLTTFVIWAKTKNDRSEFAYANYDLSNLTNGLPLLRQDWDFSKTGKSEMWDVLENVELTATPVFFSETAFSVDKTTGCTPLEVNFEMFPYIAVLEDRWFFPGGVPSISTSSKPKVTFFQKGIFEATHHFIKTGTGEVVSEQKITIRVDSLPTANFVADASSGGGYFHFQNLSTANSAGFFWDFGDGGVSEISNPDHVFENDGQFSVTLTAQNQCGDRSFSITYDIDAPTEPGENFTALDSVAAFNRPFRAGTTFKSPAGWADENLADIAAGNVLKNEPGAGVRSGKFLLPQYFLDFWGYDIREKEFQHFENLNLSDNTVILGSPNDAARETWNFCPNDQPLIFKNLYADIWDGGENGSPINELNPFAFYVFKTVEKYRDQVQFWEVYDSPDFDLTGKYGWLPPGEPENWWDYDPEPCATSLRAPIQTYVRMLRITFEIVKKLDPDGYVLLGGIGYPSFLDALLRNTDNPDAATPGMPTANFPHGGGAYFDALGFNSYPFVDGSTSFYDHNLGQTIYQRHSDAAAEGIFATREKFQEVLGKYGFDGQQFPEKKWVVTEANTPRKIFGEYFGGEIAQRNYLVKAMVETAASDFVQFNANRLSEAKPFSFATGPDDLMGLYSSLENVPAGSQKLTPAGEAFRTASDVLFNTKFDADRTAELNLPLEIAGFAFRDALGKYVYVLWAKTWIDLSENDVATFSFPNSLGINDLYLKNWDWAKSKNQTKISPENILLTASPIFLTENELPPALPLAVFSAQKHVGCAPFAVQFSNLSKNATEFLWHFDGGVPETSTAANPISVFSAPGKYKVSLTAKNALGQHTTIVSDFVKVPGLPTADFSFEIEKQVVRFKNLATGIDSVKWILHDGTTVAAWEFDRFYFNNGVFPVKLVVFSLCGSDTILKNVTVEAPPVANFNIVLPNQCGQFYAAFQNFSGSSPDSIFWSIPGASPSFSTDNDVWATFPGFGNYTATLIVKNQFGSDTLVKNFTLANAVYSQFSKLICENETVKIGGQVFDKNHLTGEVLISGGSVFGCDSIVQVNLGLINTSTTDVFDTIPAGSSVQFCGQNISAPGIFTCNLTGFLGCDSTVFLHLEMISAEKEPLREPGLQVFPNPFSDKFFVEWEQFESSPVGLVLQSATGQIVFQLAENQMFMSGKQRLEVALPGLPLGVFWVVLRTKNGVKMEKLVRG